MDDAATGGFEDPVKDKRESEEGYEVEELVVNGDLDVGEAEVGGEEDEAGEGGGEGLAYSGRGCLSVWALRATGAVHSTS